MIADARILPVIEALGLPPEARVDTRVPKKLLVEQGAPTSADKRAIQEGIDELQWHAACKPSTIGVPSFSDEVREYLEIAVVACAFRPGAKVARLIELIHRAIPYPVFLITSARDGLTVSLAHKRHAESEAGKVVIERVAATPPLAGEHPSQIEQIFLQSIALAYQPGRDLCALYEGWLARIEALNAARITGTLSVSEDARTIERRRGALDIYNRLSREISTLRAKAAREKQLNRRIELNLELQRLRRELEAGTMDL